MALDRVGVDVAGEDDGEFGPGFASPDEVDGGLVLELDDGWLGQLLLVPQGLRLGGGCPGRAQGGGLGFVVLPQAELWWVHVDVALVAELDGEADLGFVQADDDEGGFGDGLGGPVGGDQPGELDEAAVAVAAGLALVEEVFGPELFEPGEVGVGVGTQAEGVAGGLHGGDVVIGVDQFHDLVVQLHQGDFGVAIAE